MRRNLAVLVSLAVCSASTRPTRPHQFYLISGVRSGTLIGPVFFALGKSSFVIQPIPISPHTMLSLIFPMHACICNLTVSAIARSRQVAQVRTCRLGCVLQSPPVLHSVSPSPSLPPVCAKYQPGPGCPPVSLPSSAWPLSGLWWARLAFSLSGGPRRTRAEADQAQASTATYLPSSPSQTTAKSFTQHSKF